MPFGWGDRETAKLERLLASARPLPGDDLVARLSRLAGGEERRRARRGSTTRRIATVVLTAGLLAALVGLGAGRATEDAATGAVMSFTKALGLSGSGSWQGWYFASTCTYEDEHLVVFEHGKHIAGTPFTVTIFAVAQCTQGGGFFIDPGYSGPKTLTWGGSPCSTQCPSNAPDGTVPSYPSNPVTFVHGSATVTITLYDAQTNIRLGVSDGTFSGTSGLFSVLAAAAAKLALTGVTFTSHNDTSAPPCLFGCTIGDAGANPSWSSHVSVTDSHGNVEPSLGTSVALTFVLTGSPGLTTPSGSTTIPAFGAATTMAAFTWSQGTSYSSTTITVSSGSFTSVHVTISET